MAKKTIKKTKPAMKKTPVKKAPVKSIRAKKPVAKKSVRKVVRPTLKPVIVAPAVSHECACGDKCCCCRGRSFIGLCINVILVCIVFLLGCISSPWLMRAAHKPMMPRVEFSDNGCVVMESIKCPKMLEVLAAADENSDGCISRDEFKKATHDMHKMHHGAHAPSPDAVPVEPMAPVME